MIEQGNTSMTKNAKMFRKAGFEGIWRGESRTLDVFEVLTDADTGRDIPHLLRSKQFANSRVAESYFMNKVGVVKNGY
jgi:hypothetical protein